MDLSLGLVLGTFGVERHLVTWTGQAAHAGSTPMDQRRDALGGAAKLALELRHIAVRAGGGAVCTSGGVVCKPGIVTSVVETAEQLLDQRHLDAATLAAMLADAKACSERFAEEESIDVSFDRIWSIEPILFHPELIELCDEAILRGHRHVAPAPVGAVARCGRGSARRDPDGDALRPEPPRSLAHAARGHEGGAPRARGRRARQADDEDDRVALVTDGLRFGVHSGQQHSDFAGYLDLWRAAEELGLDWASASTTSCRSRATRRDRASRA